MRMNITKKIGLFLLLVMSITTLKAQVVLEGTISNSGGEPEPFANISLPEQNLWGNADENGKYKFENVEAGNVLVEIDQTGYDTLIETVEVATDGVTTIDFVFDTGVQKLEDVVVTGTGNPKASIKASVSISTLKTKDVEKASPRSTAEIFRTIPGIRSESSGGEGNSNITVRGIPVSAGGSRYLLIQEDGLPVLQFGDIAFATQDQFVRYDSNVGRIEALRGGSASVLASNSPAGIINFISKDGKKEGGSVATTLGLDYSSFRTDFEYGAPISDDLSFHLGGFYRLGDGPRKTGYTSNNGGQFKFNVTKKFEKGYVKLYAKFLDDRTASYMPMPMQVSGTNSNPDWGSMPNYDAVSGSLQSAFLQSDRTLDGNGNILNTDVSDGMHSISKSLGAELSFNIGNGWKIIDKGRFSWNNGQFVAPFTAGVGSYDDIVASVSGYNSATYAGTSTAANTADNYMRIAMFNTKLNNFNNFVNDLNISKKFSGIRLNAGIYKSYQKLNMSWFWNEYIMEVNDDNARLIDVYDASGNALTSNGLVTYGIWGLNRNYNTSYDVTAPYAQIEIDAIESLNIEAGLRYDFGKVSGDFTGGGGETAAIDMNQNGTIDAYETAIPVLGNSVTTVDYDYGIFSYSVGANYKINKSNAVFARVSKGGAASADRILFGGYDYMNTDDPELDAVKVNTVSQQEVGYKLRNSRFFLNTTLFRAETKESNYEATTQKKFDNTYESFGVEFDGYVKITDQFDIKAGLTYTKAEIKKALDESVEGNTPRRLPSLMYSVAPSFYTDNFSVGATLIGASKSYAQDNNELVMNGYLLVNPFVGYKLDNGLSFTLNANNLFDTLAVTESEEGVIAEPGQGLVTPTNFVRARALPGRSVSLKVQYEF